MPEDFDSTDRRPADYLLVAITFVGLAMAGGGVIVSSPGLALSGAAIALLALLCLLPRAPSED